MFSWKISLLHIMHQAFVYKHHNKSTKKVPPIFSQEICKGRQARTRDICIRQGRKTWDSQKNLPLMKRDRGKSLEVTGNQRNKIFIVSHDIVQIMGNLECCYLFVLLLERQEYPSYNKQHECTVSGYHQMALCSRLERGWQEKVAISWLSGA